MSDYDEFPLVGAKVFVRAVTYHYIGYARGVEGGFLVLEDASWVADSGRWADALATGVLQEVEPYPGTAYVNMAAIVDCSEWTHPLPREQK